MAVAPSATQDILSVISKSSGTNGAVSSSGFTGNLVSSETISKNYDMFLQLMTTQLKNQNPLEPMSADQFMQQLTQFSGIEQQMKTNSLLTQVIGQANANATMSVLSFLGKSVTANGAIAPLKGGSASWTLNSPSTSTVEATITIRNANGEIISTSPYSLKPGAQTYLWNGHDQHNIPQSEGDYTLSVEAKDATGSIIPVSLESKGTVTGIDFSGDSPILLVGNRRLRIGDILAISTAPTP